MRNLTTRIKLLLVGDDDELVVSDDLETNKDKDKQHSESFPRQDSKQKSATFSMPQSFMFLAI